MFSLHERSCEEKWRLGTFQNSQRRKEFKFEFVNHVLAIDDLVILQWTINVTWL